MELTIENILALKQSIADLDARLGYVQLLLERMEVLARRVADGELTPDQIRALQNQFGGLIADIDRVASMLPNMNPPKADQAPDPDEGGPDL